MREYEDFTQTLRVLEWTEPTPGLPLITEKGGDVDGIFAAYEAALDRLEAADRRFLGICGIVRIPKADYLAVKNPEGTGG